MITIDTTSPVITITGDEFDQPHNFVTITAVSDGEEALSYKIQSASICSTTAPTDATQYPTGGVVINDESNNNKYVCFYATDIADNFSSNVSEQIQNIDTTTTAPSLSLKDSSNSGITTDGITNNNTPDIRVSNAEAGSNIVITATKQGETPITQTGIGNDDITLPTLSDGEWSITATATDIAGNVSDVSTTLVITIDTTLPTITITNPNFNTPSQTKTITAVSDGEEALSYKIQSASVCSTTPPTDAIQYPTGGVIINNESDNSKYVCFYATDIAGNFSSSVSEQIQNIDTGTTAPSLSLSPSSNSGITTDLITNDSTPDIRVTNAETGSTVNITATKQGETPITLSREGNGDITLTTLSDGEWSITATATDTSGNVSDVSTPLVITIDITLPTIPALTLGTDTGSNTADGITNDNTPNIGVANAETGSTINITATKQGETPITQTGTGNGDITLSTLSDGEWSITATATDTAGNVSAVFYYTCDNDRHNLTYNHNN